MNRLNKKNKKFILAAILFTSILIFSGCTANLSQNEFLYYQKYPAEVTLTLNNESDIYTLVVALGETSSDEIPSVSEFGRTGALITVKSPNHMSGVQYIFDSTGTYISSDDLKIPVNPTIASGLYPLLRGFCVDKDSLISTDTDKSGAVPLTVAEFRTNDGKLTLYLDESGIPVKMIFDGIVSFTADIDEYVMR